MSLLLCPLSVERYYFPLFVDFAAVYVWHNTAEVVVVTVVLSVTYRKC